MAVWKDKLKKTDLVIDSVYEGGRNGNVGDDPLPPLLGLSNSAGFRYLGKLRAPRLLALVSSFNHRDWPDHLDRTRGVLTYYGDNRNPGAELHDTGRFGNILLRDIFANSQSDRHLVPPILVFEKIGHYRDVRFLGLAVPGAQNLRLGDDLLAIWRSSGGHRFQNYVAKFTILDEARLERRWLNTLIHPESSAQAPPKTLKTWRRSGKLTPLVTVEEKQTRSKAEQLPEDGQGQKVIATILEYFRDNPHGFEACAVALARMTDANIDELETTRAVIDFGRDAIGTYLIGSGSGALRVEFALEAKCWNMNAGVGVKDTSRLISRIRHRQFGVFVTTSYIGPQAYKEIVEDEHPIIILAARDIVELLRGQGLITPEDVRSWMEKSGF